MLERLDLFKTAQALGTGRRRYIILRKGCNTGDVAIELSEVSRDLVVLHCREFVQCQLPCHIRSICSFTKARVNMMVLIYSIDGGIRLQTGQIRVCATSHTERFQVFLFISANKIQHECDDLGGRDFPP